MRSTCSEDGGRPSASPAKRLPCVAAGGSERLRRALLVLAAATSSAALLIFLYTVSAPAVAHAQEPAADGAVTTASDPAADEPAPAPDTGTGDSGSGDDASETAAAENTASDPPTEETVTTAVDPVSGDEAAATTDSMTSDPAAALPAAADTATPDDAASTTGDTPATEAASAPSGDGSPAPEASFDLVLAPNIEANVTEVDFGQVLSGTTVLRTVTVTNSGDSDVTLADLEIIGGGASAFAGPAAPLLVPAGSVAMIDVAALPAGPGDFYATLIGAGGVLQIALAVSGTKMRRSGDTLDLSLLTAGAVVTVDSEGDVSATDGQEEVSDLAGIRNLRGSGHADTLRGPPAARVVWDITGVYSGAVAGLSFISIETLEGAEDNEDVFVVHPGGRVDAVRGGEGGWDLLKVAGTTVIAAPTGLQSGTVVIDGSILTYAGLEPVDISAASVTINGADQSLLNEADFLKVTPKAAGEVQVQFRDPFDLIDIAELHWFTVAGTTDVTINGGDGRDIVRFEGTVHLGSASLTVNAEEIQVGGAVTTTGNVTLAAADTVSGGVGSGVTGCIVKALFSLITGGPGAGDGDISTTLVDNLGTHCSGAFVTVDGGSVSGAQVDITATSTATPDEYLALVPRSHADITVQNSGSVSGTGNVTLKAEATVTIANTLDDVAGFVGESRATVLIDGGSVSSSGGSVTIESHATFTSTNEVSSTSSGAIAVSVAISTASTKVIGSSNLTATANDLTVKAVNGTAVTVSVDGVQALTYTFGARILNGQPVGLNKGLIGVGSDNSRGVYDNVVVQALPPELTLDSTEYFEDGAADQFAGLQTGSWWVSGGRYVGAPAGSAYALDALDPGALLRSTSYVGEEAVVAVSGIGGVAFDIYQTNDFKFVALDSGSQSVLVGHVDPRRGWVVDASFAATLSAGTDYSLGLELRGTVATVTLNGFVIGSYAYNAAVADGRVGTLSRTGTASFERFRLRTDDPAFIGVVLPPEIRVMNAAVDEGASGTTTIVAVTLQLSQASSAATTVSWTTEPGSALPGVDYIAASGTATFAAGSTTAVIQVAVLGDGAGEANETFGVVLTSWANFNLADGTGSVTITNDDPLPVITVSVADDAGAEEGSDPIRFTVGRTNNLEGAVSVGLSWTGAAALGADYVISVTGGALSSDGRVLTLPSGATSATITVTPIDDAASEPPESVTLTLLSGAGYSLGSPSSGSGAIADNDGNVVGISIGNASVSEGSKGTSKVSLKVTLSASSASTVTVNYATVAGSATAGIDYQSVSGTLSFKPGVTSMTISVVIYGDKVVEPDETFMVVLSEAVNAAISAGIGTVTIRNDDRGLLADGPSPASAATPRAVSRTELETVVARAEAAWLASVPGADFSGLSVAIEDLDGLMLGHTSGREITIDLTAAGWGWSMGARGHGVDLFAVVMHELGHVLGLDHTDSAVWSVMAGTYPTGTARWAVALSAPLFGRRQAALSPPAREAVAALTPLPLIHERPGVGPGQRWLAPSWPSAPQSPALALDRWRPTAFEEAPGRVRIGDAPPAVGKVLRVWFTYQRWLRSLR